MLSFCFESSLQIDLFKFGHFAIDCIVYFMVDKWNSAEAMNSKRKKKKLLEMLYVQTHSSKHVRFWKCKLLFDFPVSSSFGLFKICDIFEKNYIFITKKIKFIVQTCPTWRFSSSVFGSRIGLSKPLKPILSTNKKRHTK